MLFKNVIGQQSVKNHLVKLVQQNRLGHALLFLGKEGAGALPLAIAFANYICLQGTTAQENLALTTTVNLFGNANDHSGQQNKSPQTVEEIDEWMAAHESFSKVKSMVHPDIHFSYPVISKKSGDKPLSTDFIAEWREFIALHSYGNLFDWLQFIHAENKQGNITAHECTDIIKKFSLKSFESAYKILIMWMPELLGKEGNKLLKLIEEPPPNTLFIFVAEDEDKILPTILSRTQLIKINILSNGEIENALSKNVNIDADKTKQVALLSQGNYHEALNLLQHTENDWQIFLREWLNHIAKNNTIGQVKWIEEAGKLGREKQKHFLNYFIHLLELSVKQLTAHQDGSLNVIQSEADFAARLNKLCNLHQQEAIANELDQAIYYIERNANAKMLFHALTIKLTYIINNNSLILMN